MQDALEPQSDTHVQTASLTCRVAMVAAAALASDEAASSAAQEAAVGGADVGVISSSLVGQDDPATALQASAGGLRGEARPSVRLGPAGLSAQELLGALGFFSLTCFSSQVLCK